MSRRPRLHIDRASHRHDDRGRSIGLVTGVEPATGVQARKDSARAARVDAARTSGLVDGFSSVKIFQVRHGRPRGIFGGTFEGTHGQDPNADDLIFYTTAPSPLHPDGANGEIKQVELTMPISRKAGADHILVRRSINNLSNPPTQPPADEEVLCRHVRSFNLFYFDGSNWQDTWDSTSSQPANYCRWRCRWFSPR